MRTHLHKSIAMFVIAAMLAALAVNAALAAIIVMDEFTPVADVTLTDNSGTPAAALTQGAAGTIFSPGNERDLVVARTSGTGNAQVQILTSTNYLNFTTSGGSTGSAVVTWDADEANVADASILNPMPTDINLRSSNNINFHLEVLYANNPVNVQLEVFSNGVCYKNDVDVPANIPANGQVDHFLLFFQFAECTTGTPVDLSFFQAVDAVRMTLTASVPNSEIHLNLVEASTKMDHGDLPETYGDARHSAAAGGRLGFDFDTEDGAQFSTDALGDDNHSGDDEDAAAPTPGWRWTEGTAASTHGGKVDVGVNYCVGSCTLAVWVDWDRDGSFQDDELVHNALITNGSHTIAFDIPIGAGGGDGQIDGAFALRFRLFLATPYANPSPIYDGQGGGVESYAVGGEVEDYFFNFSPTAVTLAGLNARTVAELPLGIFTALFACAVLLGGAMLWARRKA